MFTITAPPYRFEMNALGEVEVFVDNEKASDRQKIYAMAEIVLKTAHNAGNEVIQARHDRDLLKAPFDEWQRLTEWVQEEFNAGRYPGTAGQHRAVTMKNEIDRLRKFEVQSKEQLRIAIAHLEHMANWIGLGPHQRGTYSFEALGEDMPNIKAAASISSPKAVQPKSTGFMAVRADPVGIAIASINDEMPDLTQHMQTEEKPQAVRDVARRIAEEVTGDIFMPDAPMVDSIVKILTEADIDLPPKVHQYVDGIVLVEGKQVHIAALDAVVGQARNFALAKATVIVDHWRGLYAKIHADPDRRMNGRPPMVEAGGVAVDLTKALKEIDRLKGTPNDH